MARPLWLVRPRNDGGCDYVNFVPGSTPGSASVEMREGSHLPPQMPLLKRRCWLQRMKQSSSGACFSWKGGIATANLCFEPGLCPLPLSRLISSH